MSIKIAFTDNCGLSDSQRELVSNWPALLKLLRERALDEGFETSRVLIRSAGIVGPPDKQRIIMADGRVFYKTPGNDKVQSYHLSFMPSASILVLAFHDVGREIVGRLLKQENYPKPTTDNVHVVIVRQPRWAENNLHAPEPVAGQSNDHETSVQTLLREAREELGENVFDYLGVIAGKKLGESDIVQFQHSNPHPALSEPRNAFATVIPVTSEQLEAVRKEIRGKQGGEAAEGECTSVDIMSLRDVLDQSTSDITEKTFVSFMRTFGIPVPHLPAKDRLPMPYVCARAG